MKIYYSIFFHQKPFGDRLNIGILMFDGKHSICHFSEKRLKLVKTLQPKGYYLFSKVIKQLDNTFNNWIVPNKKQIEELHYNSNNMFGIDKPKVIDVEFNQENYDKLFNKILD